MTIGIVVNGKPLEVEADASVEALLAVLGYSPHAVIVERNGEALRRADVASVTLRPGDRLEVVRMVAGG